VTVLWGKKSRVKISLGTRDFFFSQTSRAALEPSQPPVQKILVFFLAVKQLAPDIDHSPPSSLEAKNEWNFTSTPCYMPSWHV